MIEEQMKILKFMREVTGRTDMSEFARKIGLTSNQVVEYVHELSNAGFVKKGTNGYSITDKGKAALKVLVPVPADMKFHFFIEIGNSTGSSAGSIGEFYDLISKVDTASLEFHLFRSDFENWVRIVLKDEGLADNFACVRDSELKGEDLRKALLKALEERFSFEL